MIRKLLKHDLLRGSAVYMVSSIINSAIPLILLPVLTRYLTPAEYGEVAIFLVWTSLIGAVCGLSVHGAANRKYFDYENPDSEIGDFIGACICLLILSSFAFAVMLFPLAPLLVKWLGIEPLWLWLGLLVAICNFLIQLRLGQWQVRKRSLSFGSFQISRSFIDMLLSLALVVLLSLGATGRLSGVTVTAVLFGMTAICSLRMSGLVRFVWRPDLMKEAMAFGVPLIPHILGAFLLITADRAVVGSILGLEEAGYYMVAAQIALALGILLDAFNKAYSPWLFERLKRNSLVEKVAIVKFSYGYIVTLLVAAAIGFWIGGDVLIFIAGESYSPAASIVGWLFLAQAFRGIYFLFTSYIFFAKKTFALAKITLFTGMLHVSLLVVMLNWKGLEGAGVTLCISMFIQMIVTAWVSSRLVSMPWGVRNVFTKNNS
ncbi:lipopolysaccharide biosynthesis protein [Aliidiomarina sp. Khilg15.8]